MCIEDINIGRNSPGHVIRITVGVSSIEVLGADPDRTAIIFNAPSAGTITYVPGVAAVALQGLAIGLGDEPVKLTLADHGQLITGPWFAVADLAGRIATFFLTSFPGSQHGKTRE